jgi:hypothetical protein
MRILHGAVPNEQFLHLDKRNCRPVKLTELGVKFDKNVDTRDFKFALWNAFIVLDGLVYPYR